MDQINSIQDFLSKNDYDNDYETPTAPSESIETMYDDDIVAVESIDPIWDFDDMENSIREDISEDTFPFVYELKDI